MQLSYTVSDVRHGKHSTRWILETIAMWIGIIIATALTITLITSFFLSWIEVKIAVFVTLGMVVALVAGVPLCCILDDAEELNKQDNKEIIMNCVSSVEETYGIMFDKETRNEFLDTLIKMRLFNVPETIGGAWVTLNNDKMLFINLLWTVKGKYRINEPTELDIEFYIEDGVLYDVQYRKLVPGKNIEKQLVEAGCAKLVVPLKVAEALDNADANDMDEENVEELEIRENNKNES